MNARWEALHSHLFVPDQIRICDLLLQYPCEAVSWRGRGQLAQAQAQSRKGELSAGAMFPVGGRPAGASATLPGRAIRVPAYLTSYYWWAYIDPRAVRLFERQWLVNLILWGNYARLRDAALAELGEVLPGRTLQVACVYGDLTGKLSAHARAGGGTIDIVDVLPVQLTNLRKKLPASAPVRYLRMDSADLNLPDACYDRALLFFLLHEQPRAHRERTLSEVFRVVRPGGKIVIVDYAMPRWWHPLRYLWRPLLTALEPFALDLWRQEILEWAPAATDCRACKHSFFGGLYQKIALTR